LDIVCADVARHPGLLGVFGARSYVVIPACHYLFLITRDPPAKRPRSDSMFKFETAAE
jgi:hypothetical protein